MYNILNAAFCHFLSGDLPQLCPPLSAPVEKESLQQHLVVSHCTCGVSDKSFFFFYFIKITSSVMISRVSTFTRFSSIKELNP